MSIPAEPFPEEHLRAEEKEKMRGELCRFIRAQSVPISESSPFAFSGKMDTCLSPDAVDTVHLGAREKRDFRDYLRTRIHVHREHSRPHLSFSTFRFVFPRMIAACCVLLILGNGVAYASYGTLPGDRLYPVKLSVVEPAYSIITVTDEGRAQWATTLVRRRLLEAEQLIVQNRLTADTWDTLYESIEKNTEVAESTISAIVERSPRMAADLSADLHLILNAHGKVFADVGEAKSHAAIIRAAADLSIFTKETAHLYAETQEAASGNADVEEMLIRAMHSVSNATDSLGAGTDYARDQADSARQFLKQAKRHQLTGKFRESLRDVRMASQKAEEGNVFVRMGVHLDPINSPPVIEHFFSSSSSILKSNKHTSSTSSAFSVPSSFSSGLKSAISLMSSTATSLPVRSSASRHLPAVQMHLTLPVHPDPVLEQEDVVPSSSPALSTPDEIPVQEKERDNSDKNEKESHKKVKTHMLPSVAPARASLPH